ncbi:MAG: hypothetical protein ACERLG_04865 [Sedimentibacter sp.]
MKNNKFIPRLLITILGIAIILMGVSQMILGMVGKSTPAVITSIRRESGERADGKSGRYTYSIGYTFTTADGIKIDGFTKKISNSVYLKPDGTSIVRVLYLSEFPHINAMEQDTGIGAGQITLIIAGSFLIYFMNTKKS